MQDIAVKPAVSDPTLNTVECLTGGHRKAAAFPGVQQALHWVCWFVLVITLGMSTVVSQIVLMKLKDYCKKSAGNDDKSRAAALLLLFLFVLVVGFILMFVALFVPVKQFDLHSDVYMIAFVVVYFVVFFRRLGWWLWCTRNGTRIISNLVDGYESGTSTNIWSCIVHPALFSSLHHLLWIVLGIITEPFWAVPVLMAICTVLFIFYYLVYQYHKGMSSKDSSGHLRHSAQALGLSIISFLLVGLFIFTLLVVGQAFLSESLIANIVQSVLVIVTTLWFKYAKSENTSSKGKSKDGENLGGVTTEQMPLVNIPN